MLIIKNLSHTYANGVEALRGIDLRIDKGMFGLLGPNGAGKSTLMRILATLQQPASGSIYLDGLDVLARPNSLRGRLGYLPQDFGTYPRGSAWSLLDHLAVLKGITNRAERKQLVTDLLLDTNLYQHRKQRVAGFSGGMRRRLGIAQALIGNPDLLIVDEPTAGLDPAERNRFHNLLAEIGEDRVVLLSTHLVSDVADLCQRTAVLAGGRLVAEGTPAELIASLEGRVWLTAVERGQLARARRLYRVISDHLVGGRRMVRVLADSCPDSGCRPVPATLEDVYFLALDDQARAVAA